MTPTKRLQDMLPALVMFAVVSIVATYLAFALILRDPWWTHTFAELRQQQELRETPPAQGSTAPARQAPR